MTVFQAVVLGIVQGLGEFLPISSSAHLILVPWLAGWPVPGLTFDVALHMGTLLAVVLYFWHDWLNLIRSALRRRPSEEKRLFWYLVVATIPGGLFGVLLEKKAETVFRAPALIGALLVVMGIVLYLADKKRQARNLDTMTIGDALWIGLSQALAILPGVSRSGSTIAAARWLHLSREAAARFSFLMSTPIILGAGILKLRHLTPAALNLPFIAGVLSSFVVGILSISFFLKFLRHNNLNIFVGYRLILGLGVILLAVFR
ncbi:undecaprenyl-diphosphate phosphatase [Acididesulfobacillus acetoxydans]|uniref:Undecaprenyl-diphosphatase n=1 Tax=Acididesulfobacillus acetoxydans TaxID=1561005 RepID=A0A8S0W9C2_9FIRM|nr:undecaprenyl-diphosphatase UppP [Acididesulfobacillus acetoxydans]CAA7602479.1 undecaprenyl-diphosphate phosphatase [Acididesulfobacillus acetoxydans]CEJ05934.1 Undecaprenyl-diphosphatase [Acididesulfobacillus acetoxydans]